MGNRLQRERAEEEEIGNLEKRTTIEQIAMADYADRRRLQGKEV